ncbi:MAG TPA: zeta toxin family protein [Blastocatellia bacterium]|nr:zeta toxin family protein [Blastocatellia bacterium]
MSGLSPKLIILAGPNGAGKSTLAPFLLRDTLGIVEYVNADTLAAGLSAFQPESVAMQAGRIMLKRLHELAADGANFAFESTLATRSYAPWISALLAQGYEFHLYFLWLRRVEIAIARVKERVQLGGHDIPEAAIRRRYRRGIRNFFSFDQPLAESWGVYDNSLREPLLIAKGKTTRITDAQQRDLWASFCEAANADGE